MAPFDIRGKVVLVTGSNRGIGKALVDAFCRAGVRKVYAAVRRLDTANPLVDEHGSMIIPLQMDLSDPVSIQAAAAKATDVQVVINNAGVLTATHHPLELEAIADLQYEMQINVFGFLHVAQAFAPILKQNDETTCLVQINSTASLRLPPRDTFATYAASKAAAFSLCQGLRHELSAFNVKVISVHPGPIATDMAKNAGLGVGAAPASMVGECVVAALAKDDFLVFPDELSKALGKEYLGYAESIIGNHSLKKGP